MKKILLSSLLGLATMNCLAAPLDGSAEAHVFYNKDGHMGVMTHVSSEHRATVTNNTDRLKTVIVWYKLCINSECNDKKKFVINVNPHATWSDGLKLDLEGYLINPIPYAVSASTQIINDDEDFYVMKNDVGTIYVKQ